MIIYSKETIDSLAVSFLGKGCCGCWTITWYKRETGKIHEQEIDWEVRKLTEKWAQEIPKMKIFGT